MNKFFTLLFIIVSSLTYAQQEIKWVSIEEAEQIQLTFAQQKIKWVSIEEAEQIQLQNPDKPMFIDVYTDWCGWCKKMDKSTFLDEEVVKEISENYIPVKFNAEYKDEIKFKNRTFKYVKSGSRGFHQLAAVMLQGQLSFPSYLVLTSEGEVTHHLRGYLKPTEFLNQL